MDPLEAKSRSGAQEAMDAMRTATGRQVARPQSERLSLVPAVPRGAQRYGHDFGQKRDWIVSCARDDPEHASYLRIEERELEAGGLNYAALRAMAKTGSLRSTSPRRIGDRHLLRDESLPRPVDADGEDADAAQPIRVAAPSLEGKPGTAGDQTGWKPSSAGACCSHRHS